MRLLNTATGTAQGNSRLTLSLATTREEVREVQRLRYKIFVESSGRSALMNEEGLDADEFDAYCDHLIVRDTASLKVVGTYRLLSPAAARRVGRYYSEGEFDLSRLKHLSSSTVEAGRACIHPDYRSGAVIMLLWAGLAAYMQRNQCEYLIGCASICLADGGHNAAAVFRGLTDAQLAPPEYRVNPHVPFPIQGRGLEHKAEIPPLLKGYLRSGAWVCGEPAWDADFHTADLFLLMPLVRLDGRYARHYLKEERVL